MRNIFNINLRRFFFGLVYTLSVQDLVFIYFWLSNPVMKLPRLSDLLKMQVKYNILWNVSNRQKVLFNFYNLY